MQKDRLAIHARRLRVVVLIFLMLSVTAFTVAVLGFDLGPAVQVRTHERGGSLAWAAVSLVPFLIALWRLANMLRRVGGGEMFSPGVMSGFRGFAFWLMVSAVAALVTPLIAGSVGMAGADAGRIPIAIDTRALLYLLASAVLFLVARMLEEAARIDAELKEIV